MAGFLKAGARYGDIGHVNTSCLSSLTKHQDMEKVEKHVCLYTYFDRIHLRYSEFVSMPKYMYMVLAAPISKNEYYIID